MDDSRPRILILAGNVTRDFPITDELRKSFQIDEFEEMGVQAIDVGGREGKERLVDAVFNSLGIERERPIPNRAHEEAALEVA